MSQPSPRIERRADFDFLRYGNVWEDADLLCQALAPRAKGGRLLSIAAAGDNCLALLTLSPKEVVAVDLNPAQLACLDLKRVAFQSLSHPALLAFLGVSSSDDRQRTYASLRQRLAPASAKFWDTQSAALAAGLIHSGKLELFLKRYHWALQHFVHGRKKIAQLLEPKKASARRDFYHRHWNTWGWRLLNRVAFSERVLGKLGRDPQFFLHAESDVTSGPSRRLETLLLKRPLPRNAYLAYQLSGNFSPKALPLYLRPQHFSTIRKNSTRLHLHLGRAESTSGGFDGFNLSNIFEYMDSAQHQATYAALVAKARQRARLVYWNLHVERNCPPALKTKVRPLTKLAASLHAKDQYWAYRDFKVDEVAKNQ